MDEKNPSDKRNDSGKEGRKVSDPSKNKPQDDPDVFEPDDALSEAKWEDLPESFREAAGRAGWTDLMPVQAKTIPYILAKRDLMVQSQTGSGKTGAFVLPILDRIDPKRAECQALVLVPTRELAKQVEAEAELLAGPSGTRTVAVYGGVGYGPQIDAFKKGAHLVVGTPGRILDHLMKRSLSLEGLEILVFDEADRMLSMGFYPDMKKIQQYLPRRRINGYMFSATFPTRVLSLAGQFLHKPEILSLSRDHIHVLATDHVSYTVDAMDKDRALVRIIEMENPASALIFCNTRAKVHYVTTILQRFGYDADELSSDLAQNMREKVLTRLRKGALRFLVATDVAARGIDISDLSHVIQYEPPEDPEAYIHRAGRTGRAGATGEAISLVAGFEQIELERIAKRFKLEIAERPLPTDEDVAAIVSERVTALLEARLRDRDKLQTERMERFAPLVRDLAGNEDEIALLTMLLDDYYHESLHSVEGDRVETEKPSRLTSAEKAPRGKPSDRPHRKGGGGNRRRPSRPRRR